ncbi:response regulator [uncultured Methylobacterium sp.]|uniref:hybrid sensor histidine kinase/response regulator n=1 Tax=uncultured Methylobacterium sp. TaxID=157278 RepID=UPI0035CB5E9E
MRATIPTLMQGLAGIRAAFPAGMASLRRPSFAAWRPRTETGQRFSLQTVSIRTRLIGLAVVLFTGIVGTNLYLGRALDKSSAAAIEADTIIRNIQSVQQVRQSFDDLRYWLTDLAVSQLTNSERRAAEARDRLRANLERLTRYDPDTSAAIRAESERFDAMAVDAVEHYTADRRVIGNTVLAKARQNGLSVDALLRTLDERLERDAARTRDLVLGRVATAAAVSNLVIAAAIVAGSVLTFLVLRSITEPLRRLAAALAAIGSGRYETPLPRIANREFAPIVGVVELLRNGQAERERLSAEAERQRRMLTDAIGSMHEAFALWGPDDRLVLSNRRYVRQMAGLKDILVPGVAFEHLLREAVGRGLADLGEHTPEAWLAWRMAEHRAPGGSSEMRFGRRWVNVTERRTHDGGTVMLYADITELKNREADLERARGEAEKANVVKSEFMANMSHELRTPLNAIIGYSQILSEDAQDAGNASAVEDLRRIEGAGNHLLGLINSILDLSKIEAGKMDVFLEDVSLAGLVQDVRLLIEPAVAKNGSTLSILLAPDIATIHSDATKLKQCLLNLLSNAAKFTKNGQIMLAVSRDLIDPDLIQFRVSDTGIGMTEAQAQRLFQAFQQADSSTTRQYGGTGLGLTITRSFARMLGGDVSVTSRQGRGSTFTLSLLSRPQVPAVPVPDAGTEAASGTDRLPRGSAAGVARARVLVVDDELSSRHIIGSHLAREGFQVLYAASGEEAVVLAQQERPDAITLDIIMPQMDGWRTLQMIKADPGTAAIPVILISMLADQRIGFLLGASAVLSKPVDRNALVSAVEEQRRHGSPTPTPILIVEDDPDQQILTLRTLERLGHRAVVVSDGREALAWLSDNPPPSLILLDLLMPGMDGFEFLREFRARGLHTGVPVIVMSAKSMTPTEHDEVDALAASFITKDASAADRLSRLLRSTFDQGAGGPPPRPAPARVGQAAGERAGRSPET